MRVSLKWYSVIVTILFVAQSTLLLVLLQSTQPTELPHIQPNVASKEIVVIRENCEPQVRNVELEPLAYIFNKFRVAATEVKRQVLKKKGERVPEVPDKKSPRCASNLIAVNYNIWNINPPWTSRAAHIAKMIADIKPDFVGFQEIRKYEGRNQLDILKELLPDYTHSFYEKVQNEQKGEEEGLGILSKYPIVETSSISFGSTDRKCLHALIQTPHGGVNFFVTHFSLNDLDQCTHALLLWEYMNSFPDNVPQILVGDMNTYFDFEWPMDLLTHGLSPFMLSPYNPCSSILHKYLENKQPNKNLQQNNQTINFHLLIDVWEEIYPTIPNIQEAPTGRWWGQWPTAPGHTFSNYGDQDPSRTDRMYFYSPGVVDNSLQLCDVDVFGNTPIASQHGETVYPSDHKGVAGYFHLEQNTYK